MPRRAKWDRAAVFDLAGQQHGLITSEQLRGMGVPRSTVASSEDIGGMFSWVLPGVHRVDGSGALSVDQKDRAALLYAGTSGQLTGVSALKRYAVRAARVAELDPRGRVHALVEHGRRRSSHGFVQIERTIALPVGWERDGFLLAPPARAVADACRRCSDESAVRALVFEVVQRRLATPGQLDRERRAGQIRGSRFLRLAVEEVLGGARSVPEGDVRRAFLTAGWTRLLFNPVLELEDGSFLASPDVYDPVTGTCLEIDSREFHFEVGSWKATMSRHGRMTGSGLAVLHSPPSEASRDMAGVLALFGRTVDARQDLPAPRVRVRRAA